GYRPDSSAPNEEMRHIKVLMKSAAVVQQPSQASQFDNQPPLPQFEGSSFHLGFRQRNGLMEAHHAGEFLDRQETLQLAPRTDEFSDRQRLRDRYTLALRPM